MKGKKITSFYSRSKKLLLIPLFVVITFTFCTNSEHSNGFSFYTNTELSANVVNNGGVFGGPVLRYKGTEGNYYSGTQNHYYKDSNELAFSEEFKNGYRVSRINYHEDGNISYRYEFEYENDNLIARRRISKSDILIKEWTAPVNGEPGSIKEWHRNGQLKFEVQYLGDLEYEGLMTLYDEEGQIIE
jgi:antitoxin component YwqK of YwqJK toxin-antitoxin module